MSTESATGDERLRFRQAAELSGEIIFLTDRDGILEYVNPAFTQAYGYVAEEVVGRATPRILTDGTLRPDVYADVWRSLLDGRVVRRRLTNKAKDGTSVTVDAALSPVADGNGGIVGFLAVQRDVGERTRVERALRDSEERFRHVEEDLRQCSEMLHALVDEAPVAIVVLDSDGMVHLWNRAAEQLFGWCEAEVIGRPYPLVPEFERGQFGTRFQHVLRGHSSASVDGRGLRKDGEMLDVRSAAVPIRDGRGSIVRILITMSDVTAEKRAERALADSEAGRRVAERLGRIGSWAWDIASDAVTWSDELYRIFGREPSAGTPVFAQQCAMYAPESWVLLKAAVEKAMDIGERYELELEIVRADRTRGWVVARGELSRDAVGQIVGLCGTIQDITDRRQLEGQFRQAQKMEATGRLAGGIAHDMNNLLTLIIGYSEVLANRCAGNPAFLADLQEIGKAGDRAARLVRQLLLFSRKQVLTAQVFDLSEVISELGTMLRRVIGEDIQLVMVAAPELGRTRLDPSQIEQLVMNLAVNARDAMPKGGRLTITTANAVLDQEFVSRHPGALPGRYVELRVADTGCGVPPDVLPRVFEPFFTTKPRGQGTGLGLSTVYGAVKQSGGYVTMESELGVGTTVTSYFPLVDDAIDAPAPEAPAQSLDGNETILLVEDDVAVRDLARRMLESHGYMVLAARDAAEAIALGTDHAGPIHLLLSDVVMPDLSGPDLMQHLVCRRPTLRVLYMSGFSNYLATHLGVVSKRAGFIPKPFTAEALTARVRQMLDSPLAQPVQHSQVG